MESFPPEPLPPKNTGKPTKVNFPVETYGCGESFAAAVKFSRNRRRASRGGHRPLCALFRGGDDVILGHAKFLHDRIARSTHAETVDAEDLTLRADVFPP